eukprot:c25021_g21_i1 orf=86-829(+)
MGSLIIIPSRRVHVLCLSFCRGRAKKMHTSQAGCEAHTLGGNSKYVNGQDAQQVFDRPALPNAEAWDSLINVYLQYGKQQLALSVYQKMPKDNSVHLSGHTIVLLLRACTDLSNLDRGIDIHEYVSKLGLLDRDLYVGSSLINMYVKCGSLAEAEQVLSNLPVQNVVSWTTLIAGYADRGHGEKALHCFKQMQSRGVTPNARTFVCCLKACCSLGDSRKGEEIHVEIERHGLHDNVFVGTTLVDMYA